MVSFFFYIYIYILDLEKEKRKMITFSILNIPKARFLLFEQVVIRKLRHLLS